MKVPNTPIPKRCDSCLHSDIEWIKSKDLDKKARVNAYIWHCRYCHATVKCHGNTKHPMGIMADGAVRLLRIKAHEAFDPIWKKGYMTREAAYAWLRENGLITTDNGGFGCMLTTDLRKSIVLSKEKLIELRRLHKKDRKQREAINRTYRAEQYHRAKKKK